MSVLTVSKSLLILICSCLCLYCTNAFAQENRTALQKQIRLTDQLLRETKNQQKKTFTELNILEQQISLRDQLVQSISEEIRSHSEEIQELDLILCQLEEDVEAIKNNYVETAKKTYKSFDSDHFWLSVLSSGSLSEAYYRLVYFKQFYKHRKQQLALISQSKDYLLAKSFQLQERIVEKESLLREKQIEMSLLKGDKNLQSSIFSDLKKQERSYRNQLETQRRQLQQIIRNTESTYVGTTKVSASAEEVDYRKSFLSNKGFHTWPVASSKGLVVGKFGKTEDSYGNSITNDGIYIRTPQGQTVRSVHTGTVTGVRRLPIGGKMIIIEHGEYRTVYANLESTLVSVGDMVKSGQHIGTVLTDTRTGETTLNFLIYKMPDTFLDPEKWIVRK